MVSDRKLGQLTTTYEPSAGGAYIFNNQASEFIYVGSGGTHDIDASPVTQDRIFDVYLPEVMSYSDYYPFHMQMPNRFDNSDGYRYKGANGQESQTEITGGNSHSTAEYWMYDNRLGRRWNVDPVVKHHESPYATYANNPIWFFDQNGADSAVASGGKNWMWLVEKNDTYSKIEKRTGGKVTVSDLRKWNPGVNENTLRIGSLLNLSDPNAAPNAELPSITIPDGTINVDVYTTLGKGDVKTDLFHIISFDPIDSEGEYQWVQTYSTNDAKYAAKNFVQAGGSAELRPLQEMINYSDRSAGRREFGGLDLSKEKFDSFNSGRTIGKNEISHMDGPSRGPIAAGTSEWNGTLSLCKKVDNNWVIIATFKYSFEVTKSGMNAKPLEFNPSKDEELMDSQFKIDWDFLKSEVPCLKTK